MLKQIALGSNDRKSSGACIMTQNRFFTWFALYRCPKLIASQGFKHCSLGCSGAKSKLLCIAHCILRLGCQMEDNWDEQLGGGK